MAAAADHYLYPVARYGTEGMVLVRSELVDLAPLDALPWVLIVSVEVSDPTDSALLTELEGRLEDAVGAARGEVAGYFRSPEAFLVIAYLPADPEIPDTGWRRDWTDIELFEDLDWTVFEEALAPSNEEWRSVADMGVIAGLIRDGDVLTAPRNIDHTVLFDNRAAAKAFSSAVENEDYSSFTRETDDGTCVVSLSRTEAPLPGPMGVSTTTWYLERTANAHGGRYDGWGCPIVRAAQG